MKKLAMLAAVVMAVAGSQLYADRVVKDAVVQDTGKECGRTIQEGRPCQTFPGRPCQTFTKTSQPQTLEFVCPACPDVVCPACPPCVCPVCPRVECKLTEVCPDTAPCAEKVKCNRCNMRPCGCKGRRSSVSYAPTVVVERDVEVVETQRPMRKRAMRAAAVVD